MRGARSLAVHPIDTDVTLEAREQLVGDHSEVRLPHDIAGALILGEGIVESDFFVGGLLVTAFVRGADILGKLDQLLEHLHGRDRVQMVAGDRRSRRSEKELGLYDIGPRLGSDFAVDQLAQGFERQILLFRRSDFGEELVGQNGDVGALDAGGFHDVHDLRRDDGAADNLLNRELALGGVLLPPGALLIKTARIAWKNPTSSRMSRASSLAAASAKAFDRASTASP